MRSITRSLAGPGRCHLARGTCALAARALSASTVPLPSSTRAGPQGRDLSVCPWRTVRGRLPHIATPTLATAARAYAATPAAVVSFYKRLRVSVDATSEEIKAAYRARALECHPDVVDDAQRAVAEVTFRGVSEAYEALSDPVRRRAHDERLGLTRSATDGERAGGGAATGLGRASGVRGGTSAQPPRSPRRSKGYAGYHTGTDSGGESGTEWGSQSHGASAASASAWRRPYVRGDADRAFADAFAGKSLDQVLFETRRRKRAEAAAAAAAAAASAAARGRERAAAEGSGGGGGVPDSSGVDAASAPEQAAGHVRSVQRSMEQAAERYAARLRTQFGSSVLARTRARTPGRPLMAQPSAPPGARMPFRPFVNHVLPEGVEAPPEPVQGPICSAFDAELAVADAAEAGMTPAQVSAREEERRRNSPHFHTHRLQDGTLVSRMESLRRATRHINGAPHNQGQVYSYHRPY